MPLSYVLPGTKVEILREVTHEVRVEVPAPLPPITFSEIWKRLLERFLP